MHKRDEKAAVVAKLDKMQNKLLDTGRRNKMINYRETKRTTLRIEKPDMTALFNALALEERELSFQRPLDRETDFRAWSMLSLMKTLGREIPVRIGDIQTPSTFAEQQLTLRNLRAKTRLALDEQGTNILYLSFGFLEWREKDSVTSPWLMSPLLMMPVTLSIASLHAPYMLKHTDDEIEVNPTLAYKFQNEMNLTLPPFELTDDGSIDRYMDEMEKLADERGWKLHRHANLGLVSFLKISMYHDLEMRRDQLIANPVVQAICGNTDALPMPESQSPTALDDMLPTDVYQVVDADSSQQEAIVMSRRGVSFVMQGPPGTGKSQTITNIIAEALASGKKVLFVSEKAAALQVVLKRLTEAHLDDFCLSLHDYKANKRDILAQIGKSLSLSKLRVKDSAMEQLAQLVDTRKGLNRYAAELHAVIEPLGISLYQALGRMAVLKPYAAHPFALEQAAEINESQFNMLRYAVRRYEKAVQAMGCAPLDNPWHGAKTVMVSESYQQQVRLSVGCLADQLQTLYGLMIEYDSQPKTDASWQDAQHTMETLCTMDELPVVPQSWLDDQGKYAGELLEEARVLLQCRDRLDAQLAEHRRVFTDQMLDEDVAKLSADAAEQMKQLRRRSAWQQTSDSELCAKCDSIHREASELATALEKAERSGLDAMRQLSFLGGKMNIQLDAANGSKVTFDDLMKISDCLDTLCTVGRQLDGSWFKTDVRAKALNLSKQAADRTMALNETRGQLQPYWKTDVLRQTPDDVQRLLKQMDALAAKLTTDDALPDALLRRNEQYEACMQRLNTLTDAARQAADLLHVSAPKTVGDHQTLGVMLRLTGEVGQARPKWLTRGGVKKAMELIAEARQHEERCKELRRSIDKEWETDILKVDAEAMLMRFKTRYVSVFERLFGSDYKQDLNTLRSHARGMLKKLTDDQAVAILNSVKEVRREQRWFDEHHDELAQWLGSDHTAMGADWHAAEQTVTEAKEALSRCEVQCLDEALARSIVSCAERSESSRALELYEQLKPEVIKAAVQAAKALLGDRMTDSASLDVNGALLTMLNEDHAQRKPLIDGLKQLKACQLDPTVPMTQPDVFALHEKLVQVQDASAWFTAQRGELETVFPMLEDYAAVDWAALHHSISALEKLHTWYPGGKVPDAIRSKLLNDGQREALYQQASMLSKPLAGNTLQQQRSRVAVLLTEVSERDDLSVRWMINALHKIEAESAGLAAIVEICSKHAVSPAFADDLPKRLEACVQLKNLRAAYEESCREERAAFADDQQEGDIDWRKVVDDLEKVMKLLNGGDAASVKRQMAWLAQHPEKKAEIHDRVTAMQAVMNEAAQPLQAFAELVGQPVAELCCTPLEQLSNRVHGCVTDFAKLDQWIVYADAKENCVSYGLQEFVDSVEKSRVKGDHLVEAFEYNFYGRWCAAAMQDHPAVERLRRYVQDEQVNQFRQLDVAQLSIAQQRIRSRIIDKYPDINRPSAPGDELSILKHEMNKKQRIMPLRKLFRAIPNLLLTLKPCLMMSPLSVAHFLEAESYQFDLVVFDEASQIFPQDALGSIMRGKQVIITGDTKQLPPTNFFAAATNTGDDDYDTDDDDFEEEIGDSILEEADRVMPSSMLMWHYRSRSEQLIAYANQKLYDGKLITFPSVRDHEVDFGVEFVHVPNGVYAPKPHNCNLIEAQRCVELIADHIQQHPNRSLGVIAFSEKQQSAIQDAVQEYREHHPEHESFFDENREDAFFIKNLENVQGDERDTILFSVGYAYTQQQRDQHKPMSMRFGPLGRVGGERRLNVAITRARMNVKLVSSILPGDIDLSKTESEGVKMLRGYLEYAMNGTGSLHQAQQREQHDELCRAVADFLRQNGYHVREQLGCSGYKIDIAVEREDQPDCFFAAVECDGLSYHSAVTARDRDRLRVSVLERMDWKTYRVWSMEWLRNPELEGRKLLDFLQKAKEQAKDQPKQLPPKQVNKTETLVEKVPDKQSKTKKNSNPYGFVPYTEVSQRSLPHRAADGMSVVERQLMYIISVEQPVCRSVLYQRIASAMFQKVSSRVRDAVDMALNQLKDSLYEDDNSFSLAGSERRLAVRIPGPGQEPRNIAQIPREELELALYTVAQHTFGLTEDALTSETAKALGYTQRGAAIKAAMRAAVARLTESGRIRFVDCKAQTQGGDEQ